MSAFAALKAHIAKIDTNLRAAEVARRLPETRAQQVRLIQVNHAYGGWQLTEAQAIIAKRMTDNAAEQERAAGEVARRCELRRLAIELDALRAALPELANQARFDLLDTAREMRL